MMLWLVIDFKFKMDGWFPACVPVICCETVTSSHYLIVWSSCYSYCSVQFFCVISMNLEHVIYVVACTMFQTSRNMYATLLFALISWYITRFLLVWWKYVLDLNYSYCCDHYDMILISAQRVPDTQRARVWNLTHGYTSRRVKVRGLGILAGG
jgi:hypothetical protein